MKKLFKIVGFIFLGFVALGVIGAMFGGSDSKNTSTASLSATTDATAAPMSAADKAKEARKELTTEIEERKQRLSNPASLVSVFEENEVKATTEYKGKQVVVEGTIENIGLDIMDNPYITLGPADGIRSVQCSFEDKAAVANLKKGQQVTVQGECKGLMMNVLINDSKLIESLASMRKRLKALPK